MATTVSAVVRLLSEFAPLSLAEDWDNVGLLIGRSEQPVSQIMTCLTVTPASVAEAVDRKANLIVTHHPMPFRSLKQITDATVVGRLLLELIENRIAVYSPHTAFDSAAGGINQQLAEALGLEKIQALRPFDPVDPASGSGRFGEHAEPQTAASVAECLKSFLNLQKLRIVGTPNGRVTRTALACGAAGEFLPTAIEQRCDLLITGETSFHTCLEAEANGICLLLTGHFASERFAVETLATHLSEQLPETSVWASADETNPWRYV